MRLFDKVSDEILFEGKIGIVKEILDSNKIIIQVGDNRERKIGTTGVRRLLNESSQDIIEKILNEKNQIETPEEKRQKKAEKEKIRKKPCDVSEPQGPPRRSGRVRKPIKKLGEYHLHSNVIEYVNK